MFFIVSTGRSGSQTIARVLSQSQDCICLHEPEPVLVKEATLYHYGLLSDKMMKAILLSTRTPTLHGKIYGESNQKLSTLIPVLAEAFPEAQFIWLVRDGRDVVASTYYAREWYKPIDEIVDRPEPFTIQLKEWTWYRLRGDLTGDMSTPEWETLTRFEKNCWLWTRTNEIIQAHLRKLPQERQMLVRLETLFQQLPDICRFVGIQMPLQIRHTTYNVSPVRPISWTEWSEEQKVAFERWCGDMMDHLYPKWRGSNGCWEQAVDQPRPESRSSPPEKSSWWQQFFRRLKRG
jgi:hypothetical protein